MRARRSPEPPFPPTAWRSLGMAARQIAEIFLLLARFLLPTQASEGRPSRLKAVPKGERSLTSKSVRMSRVRLRTELDVEISADVPCPAAHSTQGGPGLVVFGGQEQPKAEDQTSVRTRAYVHAEQFGVYLWTGW